MGRRLQGRPGPHAGARGLTRRLGRREGEHASRTYTSVVIGSLRFRLPALFLLGIVLAGVVAALISLRLFQTYTRGQSIHELQREASGLSQLYADAALRAADEGSGAIDFAASKIELATGDRIFYIGSSLFPGQDSGLTRLAESTVPPEVTASERPRHVRVHAPGSGRSYLAAAEPVRLEPDSEALGAIVVAKPRTELRDQWLPLVGRLAAAFGIGALLAGLLSWWLSRKITVPVLALSSAADQIAGGQLRRARSGGGRWRRDQPPLRAIQRDGGPVGGDRGARTAVPDVRLPRAPHAADGDQGPRRRDPRRPLRRPGARTGLARRRCGRDDPARATGRRRARPGEAQRPPVHGARPGGRCRRARRAGSCELRGGGEAPRRRLPPRRGFGRADDRHRRRSCPAGGHESPLERLPLDSRRRDGLDRLVGRGRTSSASTCATRARESGPRSGRTSSCRSSPATTTAPGSGFRSPASSRSRSEVASSSSRPSAREAGSGSCCRHCATDIARDP